MGPPETEISTTMSATLSAIIAGFLMIIWVAFLFEGRREMSRCERLSYDYVFKWNVLPLMIAMELLVTHNMFVLGIGALAFVLCWPIAKFAVAAAPVITGWHVGSQWFSKLYVNPDQRVVLGALIGALAMTILVQSIVAAMKRPPANA